MARKNKQEAVYPEPRKRKKKQSLAEKIDMYDMILANLYAGNSIIEPDQELDNSKIAIGFSNIASEDVIMKYFVINQFPDWMYPHFMDTIRSECILPGVKINFYIYGQPHRIRWDSAEMRNKMSIWRDYAESTSSDVSVFEYRAKRNASLTKDRIIWATKYLNEAELDYKRTVMKVSFVIEISAKRDDESILNLGKSIERYKKICLASDIKTKY